MAETPIQLSPVTIDKILKQVSQTSAAFKLARPVTLTPDGARAFTVGNPEARFQNAPRDKKTADELNIGQVNIAAQTVYSMLQYDKQFADRKYAAELIDIIINQAPNAIQKTVDDAVFGLITPPAGFQSLGAAEEVEISDVGDLIELEGAIDDEGGELTGIAMSRKLYYALAARRDQYRNSVFNIVGDKTSGTINGIRYETFRAPTAVGFAGDYDRLIMGAAKKIDLDFANQATIGDVNLFEMNMRAVRVETYVGSAAQSLDYFRKIEYVAPAAA